jgi:hypothetical protein
VEAQSSKFKAQEKSKAPKLKQSIRELLAAREALFALSLWL